MLAQFKVIAGDRRRADRKKERALRSDGDSNGDEGWEICPRRIRTSTGVGKVHPSKDRSRRELNRWSACGW